MNFHIVTPTAATAIERHRAFHENIQRKAAELQSSKLVDAIKSQPPRVPQPLQSESFPAEPDPPSPRAPITRLEIIQRLTCEAFGFRINELKSQRRDRHLVMARQTAMYLCKRFTSQSFPWVGRQFGGRDHTTVLHACRRVELMLEAPYGTAVSTQWSAAECDHVRDKATYLIKAFCEMEASLETHTDC